MSLLPFLTQGAPPVPRKLYWRYKARAQRAMRDGDLKFLKILDHTFLFDVVALARLERHDAAGGGGELYPRVQRGGAGRSLWCGRARFDTRHSESGRLA